MSFKVLESVLRPLAYWYNQENIEEVAVNRSGQVWLRLRGKRAYPWVMYKDEKLTKEYLTDLLYIIANTYELPFDPVQGTPVVYATIPGDHRFSAVSGRNVMYDQDDLTGGVALTIRVHSDDVAFGLQDYGLKQGESLHKVNPLKDIQDPEDPYERLLLSIKRGDHILVSGATATGKTTFLTTCLRFWISISGLSQLKIRANCWCRIRTVFILLCPVPSRLTSSTIRKLSTWWFVLRPMPSSAARFLPITPAHCGS